MLVTENWSGRTMSLKPPWTANYQFVVSGTFDRRAALLAVPYQLNTPHPQNPARLKCDGPTVKDVKGNDFIIIDCPFSEPPGGLWSNSPDDPLQKQAEIYWEPCEIMEQVDHDLRNRVIANSAGAVQSAPRRIPYDRLKLKKNLPFYNKPFFDFFRNTVNSTIVSLSGIDSVPIEHMRCASIFPAIEGYHSLVEYMPMWFIFEIMPLNVLGTYPWQHRLLDAGRNGWYGATPKKSGVFSIGNEAVDFDVKLDGTGIPLTLPYGSAIKVGDRAGVLTNAPVTPPTATSYYKREYYNNNGAILDGTSIGAVAAVFNYFEACRAVDFGPLLDLLPS